MQNEEQSEEMDIQIAELVFGLPREQIDAWPWGVPEFSTDRRWSAAVILKMLVHESHHLFNEQLERAAVAWGWKKKPGFCGLDSAILILTPDEICKAALIAIREHNSSKQI